MSLHYLTYVSSAVSEFKDDELIDLLDVARRTNLKHGITGMLIYMGGNFVQALEGDDVDIDFIFDKILADSRHKDIILLEKAPLDARAFPDWTMGFKRFEDDGVKELLGHASINANPLTRHNLVKTPSCAMQTLSDFYDNNYL